jgi:hypothetical protein
MRVRWSMRSFPFFLFSLFPSLTLFLFHLIFFPPPFFLLFDLLRVASPPSLSLTSPKSTGKRSSIPTCNLTVRRTSATDSDT